MIWKCNELEVKKAAYIKLNVYRANVDYGDHVDVVEMIRRKHLLNLCWGLVIWIPESGRNVIKLLLESYVLHSLNKQHGLNVKAL